MGLFWFCVFGRGVGLCFVWVLVCCFFSRISFWVLVLTAMEFKKKKTKKKQLSPWDIVVLVGGYLLHFPRREVMACFLIGFTATEILSFWDRGATGLWV